MPIHLCKQSDAVRNLGECERFQLWMARITSASLSCVSYRQVPTNIGTWCCEQAKQKNPKNAFANRESSLSIGSSLKVILDEGSIGHGVIIYDVIRSGKEDTRNWNLRLKEPIAFSSFRDTPLTVWIWFCLWFFPSQELPCGQHELWFQARHRPDYPTVKIMEPAHAYVPHDCLPD